MFTHLHCHCSHSLLDGLGNPDAWVEAAAKKNFQALALTDHGSCSAALEFYKAAKAAGIIPIVGCEFYITDDPAFRPPKGERMIRYHLLVLAKNWNGLQSIFRQLTLANQQMYYRPLLSIDQIFDFKDCVITSACLMGLTAHPNYADIIAKMQTVYGDDFYLEIHPHWIDGQFEANKRVVTLHEMLGIKPVAANDAHYPNEEDTLTHDVLLAVQTNSKINEEGRFSFIEGGMAGLYLKTYQEMIYSFKPWIEAGYFDVEFLHQSFVSTQEIVDKCSDLEIPKLDFALPTLTRHKVENEAAFLMQLCMDGWKTKIAGRGLDETVYVKRLKHELGVVSKIGAIRYFLLGWDVINYAKSKSILCGFGRGSSGGSLIAYLLGITALDPIVHELYFERFLREDRIDMPDIDFDFAGADRDQVIRYVKKTYGAENVCQISTSSFMHGKSAFRDVARVFSIPIVQVNEISKKMDKDLSVEENFSGGELAEFAAANPILIKHAKRLDGQLRSKGVHAGGVILSQDGFSTRGVLENRKSAVTVNWHMDEVEHFGLLKFDFLGLSNLSVLGDTAALVKERTGVTIDYFSIQPNDPDVLKQFSDGHTAGFFQFESSGISGLCQKLAPIRSFETLVHINTLYRPGPLDSGMVDSYVNRYHKLEAISYLHPAESSITEETLGLPIFQEQVMRQFVDLAGFTWPEADQMRKIISKSKGAALLEEKRIPFIEGCAKTVGMTEAVANVIYDNIVKFGRYGFNKCVAGTTKLKRAGQNQYNSALTVEEMYRIRTDVEYAKKTNHLPLHNKWEGQGHYGYGFSLTSTNRVKQNIIRDIQPAGFKQVFRLQLENGSFIDATSNHKFPTPSGEKFLADLTVSDKIFFCGKYEKSDFAKINRFSSILSYFAFGENNPGYTNGSFSKFQAFKEETPDVCESCGSKEKIETHHKDGDRTNSDWNNLQKLCSSCHKKHEYKLGRTRRGGKGYPTILVAIASIKPIGKMWTWDITMDGPNHTFVTDQNIVTCNSHSACYSYIGYLTAWAKFYYPVEFITSLLRSVVDESGTTEMYIKEAHRLGIKIEGPNINLSDSNWTAVGDRVIAGFASVKNVGKIAGQKIVAARSVGSFATFEDFMARTERRAVNKRVVEAIAYSGGFETLIPNTKWIVDNYPVMVSGESPVPLDGYPDFDDPEKYSQKAEYAPGVFSSSTISITAAMDIHDDILDMVTGEFITCKACDLGTKENAPVPWKWSSRSKVLMIGQFPNMAEESKGTPFTGKTYTKMWEILKAEAGLTPGKILMAHAFACRPPTGRLSREITDACTCPNLWLPKLFAACSPNVVLAFGNAGVAAFTGKGTGIMKLNATSIWHAKYRAMVVFSITPGMMAYDESGEREEMFRQAIRKLKEYL